MPKITKVTVSYSFTQNMGNYESQKLQIGYEADLLPGESVSGVEQELVNDAVAVVHEKLGELKL